MTSPNGVTGREWIREVIAESSLAEDLDENAISAIAALGVMRHFEPEAVIVKQDDTDETLLVLASGTAEVTTFTDEPLYYLRPGMPFGEVALIDEKPRSATVRAKEPTDVVMLPAEGLRSLIFGDPALGVYVLRNIGRVLCSRIRSSNQQVAALLTLDELHENRQLGPS